MNYEIFQPGRTIFVGVDPAALNTICAIYSFLRSEGWKESDFILYTNDRGQIGGSNRPSPNRIQFDPASIAEAFDSLDVELVFLGTSIDNGEWCWIEEARKRCVRTVSFVDHWTNFARRFAHDGAQVFPDEVWVLNDEALRMAVDEGLPEQRLRIVRNPYYGLVECYRPPISPADYRELLGVGNRRILLFVSDQVREFLPNVGFDEYSTARSVLSALSELADKGIAKDIAFVIKLHPRCAKGKYAPIVAQYASDRIAVLEVKDVDPLLANYYADMVVGMFSNMVAEALLMKKKVLRVEINQRVELFRFDERRCTLVTEEHRLKDELRKLLQSC